MTRSNWTILIAGLSLFGCDDTEPIDEGELILTEGQESGTWTADPAPTHAKVYRIDEDGTRSEHTTLDVPPDRFSIGHEGIFSFEVVGLDSENERRVWGRSYPMDTSTLWGWRLPLFVSRSGRFARPPDEFVLDHGAYPPAAVYGERWLYVSGHSSDGTLLSETYDVAWWQAASAPELRCPDEDEVCLVRTLAVVDSVIIVAIGEDFLRSYLLTEEDDYPVVFTADAGLPDGLSEWSEVAGGAVVQAPDGDVYVVGATRPGEPSTTVLRMLPGASDSPELSLRALQLEAPRAGASATWLDGYGLVVVGGSADAGGVEVLAEGADEFESLPFEPDPTVGGAVAPLDEDTLLRGGGRDSENQPADTVEISLACEADCEPAPRDAAMDLQQASAFALEDGAVLFIGLGPDGFAQAVQVRDEEAEAVAVREPRRGGTAVRLPTGHIALVGGTGEDNAFVPSLELFAP